MVASLPPEVLIRFLETIDMSPAEFEEYCHLVEKQSRLMLTVIEHSRLDQLTAKITLE